MNRHISLLFCILLTPLFFGSAFGQGSLYTSGFKPSYGSIDTGSSYSISGSNTRTVLDIDVPNAPGNYPLRLVRFGLLRSETGQYGDNVSWFEWRFSEFFYTARGGNVIYPDGGSFLFIGATAGNPYGTTSGKGDRVRFDPNGWKVRELLKSDGGRVLFTELQAGYFAATTIYDPHGFATTLTYQGAALKRIQDATGRWIEFDLDVQKRPTRATSSNGEIVTYTWSTPPAPNGVANNGLARVDYADGTFATYDYHPGYYGVQNFALLKTARDVRANGRMQDVRYEYGDEVVGYDSNVEIFFYRKVLVSESHPDGVMVSQLTRESDYPSAPSVVYHRAREQRGDGAARTFNYDFWQVYAGNPLLLSETDFEGRTWNYQYDGRGMRTVETDPRGNSITNTREPVYGNVTATTFPGGSQQLTTYSSSTAPFYVRTFTDERGKVTTYDRYGNALVSQVTNPDGSTEAWTYNNFNQPTSHRLRNGYTEYFNYDAGGRLERHWLPRSPDNIFYTYYPDGHPWEDRIKTITDARNNVTTYEYDLRFSGGVQGTQPITGRGKITKIINPDGTYKSFGYDIYGNRIWEENEFRQRSSFTYDSYQRVKTAADPLGRTSQTWYADNATDALKKTYSAPQRTFSPSGKLTTFLYDWNMRPTVKAIGDWSADVKYWRYEYDGAGNLTKEREQVGGSWGSEVWRDTTHTYDARNRRTRMDAPLSRTTHWEYDAVGNVTKVTNPDATSTRKEYDDMNRVIHSYDELSQHTGYTYFPSGKLNTVVDARGNSHTHLYDASDRLSRRNYPGGSSEQWEYDSAGNVSILRNRSGHVLRYSYDSRNRETARVWDANAATPVWTQYDSASRVAQKSNWHGVVSYAYDAGGQLTSQTQKIYGPTSTEDGRTETMTYTYDSDGNRSSFGASGWWLGYLYNQRQQLTAIQFGGGVNWVTYSYSTAAERRFRTYANSTESDYNYDGAGRLNYLHSYRTDGGGWILMQQFGYDSRDRRTWLLRDQNWGDTYEYQPDGQLFRHRINVWRPDQNFWNTAAFADSFSYDAVGNRTSWNQNGAVTTYAADALNQYTSVTGLSLQHGDGRGNITTYGAWSFQYDADNRPQHVVGPGHDYWLCYDAEGRLSKVYDNNVPTYRFYDGAQQFRHVRQDGSWVEGIVWGPTPDEVVSRFVPGQDWHFYHHDPLNSVVALTAMDHSVIERYRYDAFGGADVMDVAGNARATSAFGNRRQFTGQEWWPDMGLHNYKARFYSSELGRFVQNDPIRFDAGDLNLYRYVLNNPINLADPLGLEPQVSDVSIKNMSPLQGGVYINSDGKLAVIIPAIVSSYPYIYPMAKAHEGKHVTQILTANPNFEAENKGPDKQGLLIRESDAKKHHETEIEAHQEELKVAEERLAQEGVTEEERSQIEARVEQAKGYIEHHKSRLEELKKEEEKKLKK